jgi:hypothetical protein
MKRLKTLQDYDIYIRREETLSSIADCPILLKELFTLILSVQALEWNYFGGTSAQGHSLQPTPLMQYQSELKLEAEELADACKYYKRPDDSEQTWVRLLHPIVFYRFDVEAEGLYSRRRHHHWRVYLIDSAYTLLTWIPVLDVASTFH